MTTTRARRPTKARAPWNPIREPRDKILLGGVMSAGICELVGVDSPRNYEERVGPGLSGAILVFRGIRPSHFSVIFRWTSETDWQDWDAFQKVVTKPPIGKFPRPLDIVHPILEQVGIHTVVVENVIAPTQTDDGVWQAEFKLIESRRLKRQFSKPEGGQQTPVDPYDVIIESKYSEIDSLQSELAGP